VPEKVLETVGQTGGGGLVGAVVALLASKILGKGSVVTTDVCHARHADLQHQMEEIRRTATLRDAAMQRHIDQRFDDLKEYIKRNGFSKG